MSRFSQAWLEFFLFPSLCPLCGLKRTEEGLCRSCQAKAELTGLSLPCCSKCGRPMSQVTSLCCHCQTSEPEHTRNRCLGLYRGMLGQLIHQYKGMQNRQLALFFAGRFEQVYWRYYPDWLIVPVPPRPGKVRNKGWDQVALIAHILRKRYQLPVCSALIRQDRTRQKSLNRWQRLHHRQKFRLARSGCSRISGQACLLIDDLFTTGTTLSRCAQHLRQGGAARVESLTIAVA